jgi:hypothetical protein
MTKCLFLLVKLLDGDDRGVLHEVSTKAFLIGLGGNLPAAYNPLTASSTTQFSSREHY